MLNETEYTKQPRSIWRWWGIVALLLVTVIVTAACTAQVQPPTSEVAAADAGEASSATVAPEAAAEEAAPSAGGDAATTTAPNPLDIVGAAVPSDETYYGIPVGFTENGFPYRGDPDAPLVMIEYSDYQCPFCNRYFVQTEPAFNESYVRSGEVRVIYYDFPLESIHPNAPAAHASAICVGQQGSAEQFWEMHAELFRSVEEWQDASSPQVTFARLAGAIGVDMTAFEACISDSATIAVVEDRVNQAIAQGFNATPSFQVVRAQDQATFQLIGAQPYDQFAATVDAALAGEAPPPVVAQEQSQGQEGDSEIPFWATADGWQPDPERPGYNVAGDQYRGDLDAPLTVIEFGDFQCPFCKKHMDETQPILDEKYVETGNVLWIYKHFPLSIHPQAPEAGVAAECAGEQGQFWEMHKLLFRDVESWSIESPFDIFVGYAGELGLNDEAFAACLENPEMAARVQSDLDEGASFVRGTPTFIIISGDAGSIVPGALPAARFSEILDEELAAAGVAE